MFADLYRVLMGGATATEPARDRGLAAPIQAMTFDGLTDPYLAEFMGAGNLNEAGERLSPRLVMRNAAVARCVSLISNAMGMLPCQLMRRGANGAPEKADDHPFYAVLASRPNGWQTSFIFRRLMQHRVLLHGNAYALVVRRQGRVTELIPLDPTWVSAKMAPDWTLSYEVRRPGGSMVRYSPDDIIHLMGPSEDGITGLSLVSYAGEVLGLALAAQRAAAKLFKQGIMAGGLFTAEGKLSEEAVARLSEQLNGEFAGTEGSGRWIVGEEGVKAQPFGGSARDNQNLETRKHQVEEVARIFGVPRPFLMVDDTSWGSGIEQLGIFFVQYSLAPHFVCWEQALARACLNEAERRTMYVKFNERALLRGSMKDQAEFFSKALGTGGGRPWMRQDEVRDLSDLAPAGGKAGELGTAAHEASGAIE